MAFHFSYMTSRISPTISLFLHPSLKNLVLIRISTDYLAVIAVSSAILSQRSLVPVVTVMQNFHTGYSKIMSTIPGIPQLCME